MAEKSYFLSRQDINIFATYIGVRIINVVTNNPLLNTNTKIRPAPERLTLNLNNKSIKILVASK